MLRFQSGSSPQTKLDELNLQNASGLTFADAGGLDDVDGFAFHQWADQLNHGTSVLANLIGTRKNLDRSVGHELNKPDLHISGQDQPALD
jgi:hypothetical protein